MISCYYKQLNLYFEAVNASLFHCDLDILANLVLTITLFFFHHGFKISFFKILRKRQPEEKSYIFPLLHNHQDIRSGKHIPFPLVPFELFGKPFLFHFCILLNLDK